MDHRISFEMIEDRNAVTMLSKMSPQLICSQFAVGRLSLEINLFDCHFELPVCFNRH